MHLLERRCRIGFVGGLRQNGDGTKEIRRAWENREKTLEEVTYWRVFVCGRRGDVENRALLRKS